MTRSLKAWRPAWRSRTAQAWNKFHLINAVNNVATDAPAPGGEDRRRTVKEILDWAYTLWSKPDSGVSKQDVTDMMDHLLTTKQIVFVADIQYNDPKCPGTRYSDLFVRLGDVIFEKDIEGHHVHEATERIARQILENLDDRRPGVSKGWPEDVRDEAVNTWAKMIDQGMAGLLSTIKVPDPIMMDDIATGLEKLREMFEKRTP